MWNGVSEGYLLKWLENLIIHQSDEKYEFKKCKILKKWNIVDSFYCARSSIEYYICIACLILKIKTMRLKINKVLVINEYNEEKWSRIRRQWFQMVREVFSEGVAYEHRDLNEMRELLIKTFYRLSDQVKETESVGYYCITKPP